MGKKRPIRAKAVEAECDTWLSSKDHKRLTAKDAQMTKLRGLIRGGASSSRRPSNALVQMELLSQPIEINATKQTKVSNFFSKQQVQTVQVTETTDAPQSPQDSDLPCFSLLARPANDRAENQVAEQDLPGVSLYNWVTGSPVPAESDRGVSLDLCVTGSPESDQVDLDDFPQDEEIQRRLRTAKAKKKRRKIGKGVSDESNSRSFVEKTSENSDEASDSGQSVVCLENVPLSPRLLQPIDVNVISSEETVTNSIASRKSPILVSSQSSGSQQTLAQSQESVSVLKRFEQKSMNRPSSSKACSHSKENSKHGVLLLDCSNKSLSPLMCRENGSYHLNGCSTKSCQPHEYSKDSLTHHEYSSDCHMPHEYSNESHKAHEYSNELHKAHECSYDSTRPHKLSNDPHRPLEYSYDSHRPHEYSNEEYTQTATQCQKKRKASMLQALDQFEFELKVQRCESRKRNKRNHDHSGETQTEAFTFHGNTEAVGRPEEGSCDHLEQSCDLVPQSCDSVPLTFHGERHSDNDSEHDEDSQAEDFSPLTFH